jgi:hypothetical protein
MKIPIFAHIAAGTYLIPAFVGVRYWKNQNKYMKIFTVFFVYSIVSIIAEFIFGRMGISNQILSNIFRLIQLECVLFLYSGWTQQMHLKDGLKIAGLLYLVFWSLDVSFLPFPKEFREHIATAANSIMLVASVIILGHLVKISEKSITQYSVFWIAIGIILYSAGTIVVLTMSNTILSMGKDYFDLLWHINWGFTIIANVIFARSFLCKTF